jgi:hypothetical protein
MRCRSIYLEFTFLNHVTLYALVVLFLLTLNITSAKAADRKTQGGLNVLVHGDPTVFEPYLLGREIRRITELYGDNIMTIEARSPKEFIAGLQQVSKSGQTLRSLTFRGIHGGNYDQTPYFEVVDVAADDFESIGADDLVKAGVKLKTDDNTVVFFDSCSMVDNSTTAAIRKSFQEFEKIGLSRGRFYMNQTQGSNAVQNVFTVPFYEQTGDWMHRLRQVALQAGWPVTLTIYYFMDRFKTNQGYLRDRRSNFERYYRMHASRALTVR